MITRREFLGALAAGAISAPTITMSTEQQSARVLTSSKVPDTAITELLTRLPQAGDLIQAGARVLIKPNISWPNPPEWATTTNPEVVSAIARYCVNRGATSVLVADYPLGRPEMCMRMTQVASALESLPKTRVIFLGKPRDFAPRDMPESCQFKRIEIAKELLRTTCLINVPVAKAHSATTVSFGMKNLMGLISDRGSFHSKTDLHRSIAELLYVIKPQISILDATRVLASKGPQGPGEVVQTGIVAVTTDPVALDAFACSLTRWDGRTVAPRDVTHIAHAEALGFGTTNCTVEAV